MEIALKDMEEMQANFEDSFQLPYFQAEFEGLRQHKTCVNADMALREDAVLDLLACWPTVRAMNAETKTNAYRSLASVTDCTGIERHANALSTIRGNLGISILRKM